MRHGWLVSAMAWLAAGISAAGAVARIGEARFESLEAAFAAAGDGETVVLEADAVLSAPVAISRSVSLVDDGVAVRHVRAGSHAAFATDGWFRVEAPATFALAGTGGGAATLVLDGGGDGTLPAGYVPAELPPQMVRVESGAAFRLADGAALRGHLGFYGAVENEGTFEMAGGAIEGNCATYIGGGVANFGTFRMTGGAIRGNRVCHDGNFFHTADWGGSGGGVCNAGTFELAGGAIASNLATCTNFSDGVYILGYGGKNGHGGGLGNFGAFAMSGGSIRDNRAEGDNNRVAGCGGGIVHFGGTARLADGTVADNEATDSGGGIYVSEGTFELSGASVSSNRAAGFGGGIENFGELRLLGGEVSGNAAESAGNDLDHAGSGLSMEGDIRLGSAIALASNAAPVALTGLLTRPGETYGLEPEEYREGWQVLTNEASFPAVARYRGKFPLAEAGWYIDGAGRLCREDPGAPEMPEEGLRGLAFGPGGNPAEGWVRLAVDPALLEYDFRVETTGDLGAESGWTAADGAVATADGILAVPAGEATPRRFYRLRF
jgi:predicted outer membrane repeat protein